MQVYYFSRTGRSKKIAEELAVRYHTRAEEITDDAKWQGVVGYLKGCYSAIKKEALPAKYKKVNSQEDLILVFPIWAGTFPPAIKTFLEREGRERVICIPTSGSSKLKDRQGFSKVIDLVGKNIVAPQEV
ncbi:MAG TPA: flavodoxin [Candidatus Avacidaminococcus intestinavium]|uniref:Flavodoxin n=1 Tax=Candidatus Avacidaminococcus intestinavium TaxID=2840684 RepID=A0A9D1MND0_9FIRM|nr:flavodoxin [Candidatus Avacidaminococcus intestinavium]